MSKASELGLGLACFIESKARLGDVSIRARLVRRHTILSLPHDLNEGFAFSRSFNQVNASDASDAINAIHSSNASNASNRERQDSHTRNMQCCRSEQCGSLFMLPKGSPYCFTFEWTHAATSKAVNNLSEFFPKQHFAEALQVAHFFSCAPAHPREQVLTRLEGGA